MQLKLPWLDLFNAEKTVILASRSPRRREIMTSMGIKFTVVPTIHDDTNDPADFDSMKTYVHDTALAKAEEIWERCQKDESLPDADVVISADTVVVLDDQTLLNKPEDRAHAEKMMRLLSGKTHLTYTSVHVFWRTEGDTYDAQTITVETKVKFYDIDEELLQAYLDTGDWADKAGGYGIQGAASVFIESIEGDYWNVVGLPKAPLFHLLQAMAKKNP